nr:hypothetical protein [Tanacetum cinerariifolium]
MANEGENHALVADEEAPTEFALMANTKSKVFDNSLCSKDCKKNNDSLKSKITDLTNELSEANNYIYHYKLAVAQLEGRIVEYKEREVKYIEKIRTLKYYRESNKERIESLSKQLETLKLEKDGVDGKLAGLLKASKNLDNLIEIQRSDKIKDGVGYSATSEEGQNKNSFTFEDVASPITPKSFFKFVKSKDFQYESKTNKKETPKKPQVKYVEQYRQSNKKPNMRGNQRNLNNLKSYQLGPEFVLKKKACFNCGDFTHLANNYGKRVKRGTTKSQNNAYMRPPHRPAGHKPHGAPMRSTHRPVGHRPHGHPVRPNMNCARPNRSFFNIQTHSYETRPFYKTTAVKTQYRAPWVPIVNRNNSPVNRNFSTGRKNFPTANRKFPTASRKFLTDSTKIHTADMGRKGKAIKSSACWIWKPSQNLSNKGPNNSGSSQNNVDDKGYWDNGCSRHMTGNISYLSDFEPFDGGYVSFGQGGCKITGKGTIKTGKLEFENVYFMKDLKYNLFSVSQICDNKNSVLFIDSESSANECTLWHRRLGHLNVKTMNKLVRHNLVRGLPTKSFDNDHTCTACLKGKQHKASCFAWTFFLRTKDEISGILKKLINEIENLKDLKVKIIRRDNVGEFRNKKMNDFCSQKGIKREFSNARTPQQNGVAERRNKTLIEAARTMLADAKLPVTFWAEAVNTACYVQNRVLVNKSQNKTPYELFNGRTPAIGFLKPFGCHVMILNTLDHLGKFEAKGNECYFIRYLMSSKAFRVFNKRTRRVEENLHVEFLENKAIEKGAGLNWLFDIDSLTKSMNYVPVDAGTNSTNLLGTKDATIQEVKKEVSSLRYIALPNWVHDALLESSSNSEQFRNPKGKPQDGCSPEVPEGSGNINPTAFITNPIADQIETLTVETSIPTVSSPVPTACLNDSPEPSSDARLISKRVANQEETPSLDNILSLTNRFKDILGVVSSPDEAIGVEADVNNIETTITTSPTPTLRIHKDHPKIQIIEPKKVSDAIQDPSWVEAMQEELLQFKIQNVWTLVDCPKGVRPIGTKWVLKNKKDERGIVVRNKARLVAQRHIQEEGIDYDEVFAPVARIEAIRLFLAYASFIGFTVYQMDVKSAFLYDTIDEEVGTIDQTLFIRRQRGDFILVQNKYVGDILKKFEYSDVRSSNTPMDKKNPWGKDGTGKNVDLHLYRSMIGSLLYLTASRPDIMFAVCAYARHQVTPKECHLHAVKRIFRYLKGHPKLGLWYPKESPFDLVAYSDSDYGGATQDRKSTTEGSQFLGRRLISWQCKKQTIVATLTTEAEYLAAASCSGQVLWIQNQLLDYG